MRGRREKKEEKEKENRYRYSVKKVQEFTLKGEQVLSFQSKRR